MTVDAGMNRTQLHSLTTAELRQAIRDGAWTEPTTGLCSGYIQANLVVLPAEWAYDFLLFCTRNPKPCPILEVTDKGARTPKFTAPSADLCTDLPRYRIYRHGQLVEEPESIERYWQDDLVSFLLGCSFTFEHALVNAGITMRHLERQTNVAMYRTGQQCVDSGRFHGPLVVSMRAIPAHQVARSVEISSRYPNAHGAPVHIGSPSSLGIRDLGVPDWGSPVTLEAGDVPVFWACGVTPQAAAIDASLPFMITHSPGHMFVTDIATSSIEH